jgi:hypothetical protein
MGKKKWSKPECSRVKLVAEEALLIGCKLANNPATGFGGGSCGVNRSCKNTSS